MKRIISVLLAASFIIVSAGCSSKTASKDAKPAVTKQETKQDAKPAVKFPERSLEFVAAATPGGGHDTLMRTIAKIVAEKKIVTDTITVVNKPGGASAAGMAYVNGHTGDGHYLLAATSQFIATPLNTASDVNYEDFTPIALIGFDPELVLVNADSPYKTFKDILDSGKTLNIGGTSKGAIEHLTSILMTKRAGAKLNYIPFQSDGEVAAALLGKQVDIIVSNPSSVIDYITSKKFRALAISTEKRMDLVPDVPTFKEMGYDITLAVFRGVVAPKDISKEAKAYYIDMMKKVSETDEWKNGYIKQNLIAPTFLAGDDFLKYLKDTNKIYKDLLTELGLIK
jgi:putative tricarboxylic transport membrane protein